MCIVLDRWGMGKGVGKLKEFGDAEHMLCLCMYFLLLFTPSMYGRHVQCVNKVRCGLVMWYHSAFMSKQMEGIAETFSYFKSKACTARVVC